MVYQSHKEQILLFNQGSSYKIKSCPACRKQSYVSSRLLVAHWIHKCRPPESQQWQLCYKGLVEGPVCHCSLYQLGLSAQLLAHTRQAPWLSKAAGSQDPARIPLHAATRAQPSCLPCAELHWLLWWGQGKCCSCTSKVCKHVFLNSILFIHISVSTSPSCTTCYVSQCTMITVGAALIVYFPLMPGFQMHSIGFVVLHRELQCSCFPGQSILQ